MKFVLPDQLPKDVTALDGLRTQAGLEIAVFKARHAASHAFSSGDVARFEYLLSGRDKIDAVNSSRIACHEAGHSVVAVLIGGQVAAAEVFPAGVTDRDGKNGYCRYVPGNLAVAQHEHLIAAAGAAAEAVWEHGPRATHQQAQERLTGSHDAEFLRRRALTAGAAPSVSPTSEVLPLVVRCWPAIESLAAQLDERGSITHTDVTAALGLSSDQNRHGFELNNIRGGLRPIPDTQGARALTAAR
ncbi:MAG: hypothetical protein ACRDUS_12920 [Mycobacterium sp.]